MKHYFKISLLLIAAAFLAASCKKDKVSQDQLPPITQTGANTFGCLVNGKVYIPKGFSGTGTPVLKGIYEFFNGRPYLKIITEQYENGSFKGEIYFSIDSCISTGNYLLNERKNRIVFGGSFFNGCGISGFDTLTYQKGSYSITKLDITQGIFSGTFNCKVKPQQCDTLNFTNGRFDIRL